MQYRKLDWLELTFLNTPRHASHRELVTVPDFPISLLCACTRFEANVPARKVQCPVFLPIPAYVRAAARRPIGPNRIIKNSRPHFFSKIG